LNGSHHQGIKRLAEGLEATAWSDDGLVEAVYMPNHPYLWAVQWPPEMSFGDEDSREIFTSFAGKARAG
jgi:putative glutamine amidotransferase